MKLKIVLPALALTTAVLCYYFRPVGSLPEATVLSEPPPLSFAPHAAENAFSFDLLRQVAKADTGNLCLSPWSAQMALSLNGCGARGDTALSLQKVLHLAATPEAYLDFVSQGRAWEEQMIACAGAQGREKQQLQSELAELESQLSRLKRRISDTYDDQRVRADRINLIRSQLQRFDFAAAEALFLQKGLKLESPVEDAFKSRRIELQRVDFKGDPEGSRQHLNDWGAKATRGLIPAVLPPGSVRPITRMALAQAVYFKGAWTRPFSLHATETQPFFASGGDSFCHLMQQTGSYKYAWISRSGQALPPPAPAPYDPDPKSKIYPEHGFHLVEMPYKGERLSLVLVTSIDAVDHSALEPFLTADNFAAWLAASRDTLLDLRVPRYRIAGASRDLSPALRSLGLDAAFTDKADFSGFTRDEFLCLDQVWQQTLIEVDEKGAVAAAVTMSNMKCSEAKSFDKQPEFRADRPFWYFLRDRQSGVILFCGRVSRPE